MVSLRKCHHFINMWQMNFIEGGDDYPRLFLKKFKKDKKPLKSLKKFERPLVFLRVTS